jgi:hypothetical protein
VAFETDDPLNEWQTRSDNFESPIFFLWSAWFVIDLATVFSKVRLEAKAEIWPSVLPTCHVRSTARLLKGVGQFAVERTRQTQNIHGQIMAWGLSL